MAETTSIGWCDSTFNAWIGCTEVSPACAPCYARDWAKRYYPAAKWGDFPRKRTSESYWKAPLRWNAQAANEGKRPFIFTNSLADVFDNQVDPQWRRDLFDLMRETPNLVWLPLTKRAGNIEKMSEAAGGLPANAALGATFADQGEYDRDRMKLWRAGQALQPLFTFASIEPMLTPIIPDKNAPDWIIVGGMSGPQWRENELPTEWVRPWRDFCAATGRAFYFKQWSALRAKGRGCDLDGREWKERPFVAPISAPPTAKPAAPSRSGDLFGSAA